MIKIVTSLFFVLLLLPAVLQAQPEDYNFFTNWEFDDGTNGWQFNIDAAATASQFLDEEGVLSGTNCLRWEIEEGGTELWHIQNVQQASIEEGVEYFLDFLVYYEPNGSDPLNINVSWELAGDPYTRYFDSGTIVVNTPYEAVRIDTHFVSAAEDPTANCKIFFGRNTDMFVYLDRVYLAEVPLDEVTGIEDKAPAMETPVSFELQQNYPNPFNPSTQISYSLGEQAQVSLQVYNQLGQLVNTLAEGIQSSGTYTVQWNGLDINGADVASGVYFVKMQAVGKNQMYTDFIKAIKLK
jgi:hypothetical protein